MPQIWAFLAKTWLKNAKIWVIFDLDMQNRDPQMRVYALKLKNAPFVMDFKPLYVQIQAFLMKNVFLEEENIKFFALEFSISVLPFANA